MNVISLFSGAGGLDLGLEAAGFQTRLAIEIDKDCRTTLRRNRIAWNATEVFDGDIRKFTAADIYALAGLQPGQIDVVAGGPPCQSFSNIGRRGGLDDARGTLVYCYADLVRQLSPEMFIFENVQGILRHPEALTSLDSALNGKYFIETRLIDAADFGVPQRRKRVIILGRRGESPCFPHETHSDPRALRLGTMPWISVQTAFKQMPDEVLNRADNHRMRHSTRMVNLMARVPIGKNFHVLPEELRPACWTNGKHQGADTFGRLDPAKPSVTIRTSGFNPTKGRYIHPFENRGLSTAEMATLQTFPPNYEFTGTIGSVGRQIGNAVPPLLAYHLGEAIAASLRREPFFSKTAS